MTAQSNGKIHSLSLMLDNLYFLLPKYTSLFCLIYKTKSIFHYQNLVTWYFLLSTHPFFSLFFSHYSSYFCYFLFSIPGKISKLKKIKNEEMKRNVSISNFFFTKCSMKRLAIIGLNNAVPLNIQTI